ncbi:MAG: hypothetical protein M1834_004810 [Cirrosporium novae-zelandiae]|nr:MAG: hypothetical protein M1834_004810 [Cirrosporium novae-zelandiae]
MTVTIEAPPTRSAINGHVEPEKKLRRRRASSGLGADIRGDTSAPAVSTSGWDHPMSPSPSPHRSFRSLSKRRKAKKLLRRWKAFSFKYTWVNPLVIVIAVLLAYACNPTTDNPLHAAIFISYPLAPDPGADPSAPIQYGKGKLDIAFVAFYTIVLSFTREFMMQAFIRPMAIRAGFRSRNKQSRVMEQVYTAMYFSIFAPYGLYVMSRSPIWYFNTTAMFEGYPHKTHEGMFKTYYLLQASYWAQQAIVLMLQLEKPRKDFKELVGHHIVTVSLIALSYRFHFTYVGIAVYITHDVSDFFLATSKTLNYLDSSLVGPYFALFSCVWAYGRHYLNLRILWAILTEFRTVGPYELNWEAGQYKCLLSQVITFTLLACLQAVNLFWFYLILRIAKNYVFDNHLEDNRSDDEEEEETDTRKVNGHRIHANGYTIEANGDLKKRLSTTTE